MIQLSPIPVENIEDRAHSWQKILSESRLSADELLRYLELESHPLLDPKASKAFELRVPHPFLSRIKKGDINDPLLLQVMPQASELLDAPGFVEDPLEEQDASPRKGIIHKYGSRVLIVVTQACAIHCRYCFRRNFPYDQHRQSKKEWQDSLEYIAELSGVNEVILSGGDPLSLDNEYLGWWLKKLDVIPHIKRIRIHSRLPIVLPQRVDKDLLRLFGSLRSQLIMVVHINHANEIDDQVSTALNLLSTCNMTLLNQSVLLRDVNDCPKVLANLSDKLFENKVLPYYLFKMDQVKGTAHFDISQAVAITIYKELLATLPGYLVPKFVKEVPKMPAKTPIDLGLTS